MMFVDGQNLFHGAKQFDENLDIDFVSLADELTDGRDLIRSYYFDSFVPEKRDDKEGFYTFLETNGYRVIAEPSANGTKDTSRKVQTSGWQPN